MTAAPAIQYEIYRGTSVNHLVLLDTVSGSTTAYVDDGSASQYSTGPTFQYFTHGTTSNWYAAYVQTNSTLNPVSGVSINSLSYGFPYSDQGGISTNVSILPDALPATIGINVGTLDGPTFYTQTLADAIVNTSYSQTLVVTGSGGPATFSVTSGQLPSWLSLDLDTGILSGNAPSTPGTSTSFTITATNSAGSIDRTFTVTVDPAAASPLIVVGATNGQMTLGATDVGSSFTRYLQVFGGSGSYAISFAALTGVTISGGMEKGVLKLTGSTNSQVGDVPQLIGIAATISDSNPSPTDPVDPVNVTLYFQVNPTLAFDTTKLPQPTSNEYYYQKLETNNSGADTVTFSVPADTLPDGLTLTPWGVICGTTTDTSKPAFTVTATDSSGNTAQQQYTLTAQAAPAAIQFATTTLPDATPGTAYTGVSIEATGGYLDPSTTPPVLRLPLRW